MADGLCHIITVVSPHGNLLKIYFYLIPCDQKTAAFKAFKKLDVLDNLSIFEIKSCFFVSFVLVHCLFIVNLHSL